MIVASTSAANMFSSNKHTRKAEMRSISCTLGWPVPFYPSSRNQKISFQGWLLRRCYFAIDRGFTNAKWLLRLYQRTLEGSDRAFLVTPWKGGVWGLDMFFHPPLDHYQLYLNDINWPFSQEWTDFEAAGGATRLSDGHFSNHWGITDYSIPLWQWTNPIPCDWGEPPDRRIFLDDQLISLRVFLKKRFFSRCHRPKWLLYLEKDRRRSHSFGEGTDGAMVPSVWIITGWIFFRPSQELLFRRCSNLQPICQAVASTESLVSVSCFQRLKHSWWELHFKIQEELCPIYTFMLYTLLSYGNLLQYAMCFTMVYMHPSTFDLQVFVWFLQWYWRIALWPRCCSSPGHSSDILSCERCNSSFVTCQSIKRWDEIYWNLIGLIDPTWRIIPVSK